MRPVSRKRQRRDAVYAARRRQAHVRAEGRCEAMCSPECNGQAQQTHHVAGRGGRDPHRLENLKVLCDPCHRWVHGNVADAYDLGLMARRNGPVTP